MVQFFKRQVDRQAKCILFDQYFIYRVHTVFVHIHLAWKRTTTPTVHIQCCLPMTCVLQTIFSEHFLNCITKINLRNTDNINVQNI